METIIGASGAAVVAGYLVNFFKLARPGASSGLLIAVAVSAGQFAAALATMVQDGIHLGQKPIGTIILMGILASAAASGLSRTNNSAEAARTGAGGGTGTGS